jgi:hypothetical protein
LGITGYLEEYANIKDLQLFFQDQVPGAVNPSFKFVSIKGVWGKMPFAKAARLTIAFYLRWPEQSEYDCSGY